MSKEVEIAIGGFRYNDEPEKQNPDINPDIILGILRFSHDYPDIVIGDLSVNASILIAEMPDFDLEPDCDMIYSMLESFYEKD